jgi:membrane protease YdiL (CAAX protease family)
MLSAFQTLNNEGQSLWMLYTLPRSIEDVLHDKLRMWMVLSLVYPALIGAFALAQGAPSWQGVLLAAAVGIAVPIFARIAVALGVFACDPLEQDVRTRVRPSYTYLYLSLAGMVSYALFARDWWQIATFLILTAGLSQALWQKARDALPYLLDPVAAPPARVSTADGLIAALAFVFVQALVFALTPQRLHANPGRTMLVAFALAGAIVYGLARLIYWRGKTAGVPRVRPQAGGLASSLVLGPALGAAAAALAFAYMAILPLLPWAPAMPDKAHAAAAMGLPWRIALAVVAAPVFEEFIFRGLLFGGLRRSLGLVPAMVLSAGLFAIVHPHVGMAPVFVLGLCAAWAYDRTRGLLAPMLVHAVYNGALVLVPLIPSLQ